MKIEIHPTHRLEDVALIFDRASIDRMSLRGIPERLQNLGYQVHVAWRTELYKLELDRAQCGLCLGSIHFIREAQRCVALQPLAYYSDTRYCYSKYAHKLPEGIMLNDDALFLPSIALERQMDQIKRCFQNDSIFIRPDSGAKVFAANTFKLDSLSEELNALKQLSSLTDDTLLVVAGVKPIEAEYRLFIVNRQVVGGSGYDHGGLHEASFPEEAKAVAQRVASHLWQIDVAYTCDVAFSQGEWRVIELNAGSTSGFYCSDALAVIRSMALAAWQEFNGELCVEN